MAKEKAKKKDIIEEPSDSSARATLLKLKNFVNSHYKRKVVILGSEKEDSGRLQTGIFSFDVATEGGVPRGKWVIFVGDESSFKSTMLYILAGKAQRVCASCMRGRITEKNFKKVSVPATLDKSNDVITVGRTGELYSKKYLADRRKRNVYCPEEMMTHTKNLTLYEYELECSVCNNPEYSIFLLVDSERNYEKIWARKWGVIHHYVALADTSNSQMTGDIVREYLGSGKVSLVGVDSLDSHGPKEENESSVEDQQMGLQARVWNKIVRIITSKFNSTFIYTYVDKEGKKVGEERHAEPIFVIINQWRESIGKYGDARVMGGGRGKNFASSLTVEFSVGKKDWVTSNDKSAKKEYVEGTDINFHLRKYKAGRPYKNGNFYFDMMSETIDNASSVLDYAVKFGIIEQGGAWFTWKDNKWQGETKVREYLNNNPKIMKQLEQEILDKISDKQTEEKGE